MYTAIYSALPTIVSGTTVVRLGNGVDWEKNWPMLVAVVVFEKFLFAMYSLDKTLLRQLGFTYWKRVKIRIHY